MAAGKPGGVGRRAPAGARRTSPGNHAVGFLQTLQALHEEAVLGAPVADARLQLSAWLGAPQPIKDIVFAECALGSGARPRHLKGFKSGACGRFRGNGVVVCQRKRIGVLHARILALANRWDASRSPVAGMRFGCMHCCTVNASTADCCKILGTHLSLSPPFRAGSRQWEGRRASSSARPSGTARGAPLHHLLLPRPQSARKSVARFEAE